MYFVGSGRVRAHHTGKAVELHEVVVSPSARLPLVGEFVDDVTVAPATGVVPQWYGSRPQA